jgi:D-glycero-D-manno-heptose 1,7-bisphosphate phosphatase
VRLLVHDRSLGARDVRMRSAARGLALRGHVVSWLGGVDSGDDAGAGSTLHRVTRARAARPSEVVLGGASSPLAVAASGWAAGAHGMVLSISAGVPPRWSLVDQWGWSSLDALALAEPSPGEDPRDRHPGLRPERLESWSEEPPAAEPDATHADVERLERAAERLASRPRGRGSRPAVFLDRDGTLVVERGYLAHADDLELLPGVPAALRSLKAAGYALVVVSNQSGVGRGLFPRSRVYEAMARLRLALRDHGVELDAIYFCPHRPDAGCACRKPGIELVQSAAANQRLDLEASVMIGDKLLDVATGQHAGARGILVRTGYGRDEERRVGGDELPRPPSFVADDLAAAAAWVIGHRADGGD